MLVYYNNVGTYFFLHYVFIKKNSVVCPKNLLIHIFLFVV